MRLPTLPTVRIADGDDYLVINEADFDPDSHTVWTARKPKLAKVAKTTDTPPADGDDDASGSEAGGDSSTPDGPAPTV